MKKLSLWVAVAMLVVSVVSACGGSGGGEVAGVPADAALKITGAVTNEVGWSEDALRAMNTVSAEYTNKDGETNTFAGVPVNTLLEQAGVASSATALVFVADDGFESEVALDEVQNCADCIVAPRDEGGFSMVMPGFSSRAQVKGVVEIKVQ
jgi:ABC-type glycerol-3-phosphate transport system substrate-binding protein